MQCRRGAHRTGRACSIPFWIEAKGQKADQLVPRRNLRKRKGHSIETPPPTRRIGSSSQTPEAALGSLHALTRARALGEKVGKRTRQGTNVQVRQHPGQTRRMTPCSQACRRMKAIFVRRRGQKDAYVLRCTHMQVCRCASSVLLYSFGAPRQPRQQPYGCVQVYNMDHRLGAKVLEQK